MTTGIYTLANDVVYDQLIALLNSIEVNAGREMPVCVIAYDDQISRVKAALVDRPQVMLLEDPDLFATWEEFSFQLWQTHPTALATWKAQGTRTRFYRVGENRRYVAFDAGAPFDRFVYMDADTLLMGPLDPVFAALDTADFAIYDFQYKSPDHIFNLASPRLWEIFDRTAIATSIFCSGFYGAKRGLFPPEQRRWFIEQLAQGDAEVLYPSAPNQSVLNYMMQKGGLKVTNLALTLPPTAVTGNAVSSLHFKARDHVLYDKGARLTFLHYIGIRSKVFQSLCRGENLTFPYRDIFLHYRYLKTPQERPRYFGFPRDYRQTRTWSERITARLARGLMPPKGSPNPSHNVTP